MDEKQILLEAWKQSVAVQMHFNEIAMKIRAFALTVIAAIITAGSFAKSPTGHWAIVAAMICWVAFYFMDRWWYHYLLLGAVLHGSALEKRAIELNLAFDETITDKNKIETTETRSMLGLAMRISDLSREGIPIPAKYKMDIFYFLVFAALLLVLFLRLPLQ